MYFSYAELCRLFETVGVSIHWEENTSEAELQSIVDSVQALEDGRVEKLRENFYALYGSRLEQLANALCDALDTVVSEVIVVPLHGVARVLNTAVDAVCFLQDYDEAAAVPILRYEITVRYRNGDEYTMKCASRAKAVQFLNQYIPTP